MAKSTQIKVPPPRPLTNDETTHTLAQWRINYKQYCKRDDAYKPFLLASTRWNASQENYGFVAAINGRQPEVLANDIEDFLYMLASFLPHGYITDKIVKKSTSFETAFLIIEENYGLVPSQETFCDFITLSRMPNEPYRQLYDRMVSFVSKHLMPRTTALTEVDGVEIPTAGDQLSVSLLNLVALQWVNKIHPELLQIVRTEYAKELRENVALAALVPRIALSIDAMLSKYDKIPAVALVKNGKEAHGQDLNADEKIMKVNARTNLKKGGGSFRKNFCPGCFYLGKRTNAQINYKHAPSVCPRSTALVAMIEAEEQETENSGRQMYLVNSLKFQSQQKANDVAILPDCLVEDQAYHTDSDASRVFMNKSKLQSLIFHLQSNVQKALSPALNVSLNGFDFLAIIDEGSELNCVDSRLINAVDIPIHVSDLGAKSAGNFKMKIMGQTKHDVVVSIMSPKMQGKINLGVCVVIKNLGVDMLIGQPAKIQHEIVTKPHLQRLSFRDIDGVIHDVNTVNRSSNKSLGEVVRSVKQVTLYPGEAFKWILNSPLKMKKRVMFSPRKKWSQLGFAPKVLKISKDAAIEIVNDGDDAIHFNKNDHIGDIREAISFDEALISKLYTLDKRDFEKPVVDQEVMHPGCHMADIAIDPDKILILHGKTSLPYFVRILRT